MRLSLSARGRLPQASRRSGGTLGGVLKILRRPHVTPQQLDEALQSLGLSGREHVMVHASLKSFGHLDGGAKAVVDTLLGRVATLVAPAFSYGTLMFRPTDTVRQHFHRDTRVSRDIGRVPQEMVERSEAQRSFHPALSFVAIGEQAQSIVASQTLYSPYQPVGALYDLDGYALLMGVDFGSNTTMHYGEYLAGMPLLTRYVPLGGEVVTCAFPSCSADFDNLLPEMVFREKSVQVGSANLRLYRVRDLVDKTVEFLQRDPQGLLCQSRSCRCQEVRRLVLAEGLRPRPHEGLVSAAQVGKAP